jgi:hypothetical protein
VDALVKRCDAMLEMGRVGKRAGPDQDGHATQQHGWHWGSSAGEWMEGLDLDLGSGSSGGTVVAVERIPTCTTSM